MDGGPTEDDRMFEKSGARLIIDSVSYQLVRGATVDFADELIKSTFEASLQCSRLRFVNRRVAGLAKQHLVCLLHW